MESTQNYESMGGVTAVVLYPIETPLAELGALEETTDDITSYSIELAEEGSKYLEEWLVQGGRMAVQHTLTFVTHHDYSPFSQRERERAVRQGMVADVTLSSGITIRLGATTVDETQYPLRLKSVTADSGDEAIEIPTTTWVWECIDLTPHL